MLTSKNMSRVRKFVVWWVLTIRALRAAHERTAAMIAVLEAEEA